MYFNNVSLCFEPFNRLNKTNWTMSQFIENFRYIFFKMHLRDKIQKKMYVNLKLASYKEQGHLYVVNIFF